MRFICLLLIGLLLTLVAILPSYSNDKKAGKIHTSPLCTYNNRSNDTILKTNELILVKLSTHVYQHISFLNTTSWGKVSCNGMLVVNNSEAIIFDTPTSNEASEELIQYVTQYLNTKIVALIPTHFHADCIGGLATFNKHTIPVYNSEKTLALLKANGIDVGDSVNTFTDTLNLHIGDKYVCIKYFGEGHTKDNVVGYFPADNIMFGGCLIKELGASKGNLEDANTKTWSTTVKNVKAAYPQVTTIIPGHGNAGGIALLDYTIKLFK